MEYVRLKDIFKIRKGKKVEQIENKTENSIRYIQINDLRNNNNIKYCINNKYVLARKQDIIIAWDGANAGTIGYGLEGAIGSTLAVLFMSKNNNELDSEYCGLFLKSKFDYLRDKCTGATIPHISRTSLENLLIPKLNLKSQKNIVKLIKLAQSLIDKRKAQIEVLDELVKSRFVEMFGDPVLNPMNFNMEPLSKIGSIGRGVSKHRPRNAPELLGGEYPLIQTGDVANAGVYIKDYEATYSELGLKQSKLWDKGTLCITIAANIAKTGILTFDACFPDSVVGFVAGEKTNNIFMYYWFSLFQKIIEEQAPESAQKNINLKILRDLKVIVPSIDIQNQFADFVKKVDKLKSKMERSLKELEDNFNSLMQRAFKGEL